MPEQLRVNQNQNIGWPHNVKATKSEKKRVASKNRRHKTLNRLERKLKDAVLSLTEINKSDIAEELNLNRKTVIEKMKHFNIHHINRYIIENKHVKELLMNQVDNLIIEICDLPPYPKSMFDRTILI